MLSLHPNAEVRIYNSIINVGRTLPQKLNSLFGNFQQVNQRMHNKLFIADGRVAITGGRNMGSEYFDLRRSSNFRDRDVLLVEGAVGDAQASFELFWEHSLAQPIEDLLEKPIRYPPEEVWERLHQFSCNPARFLPMLRNRVTAVPASLRERVGQGLFHVAERVEYVSDDPGKNNSGTLTGGGVSTDALIALVRGAKESVVIQSPYLVTTSVGLSVFKAAEDRGVQVRILTNSLSSTDNILAFSGYRRSSDALLEAGVELYESKPRMAAQAELMNGPLRERFNSKMALHAKSMVVDRKISVVGSFNLDPRSANLNTESITVIHSKEVAGHLLSRMEIEMAPENAWRHTQDCTPDKKASIFRRLQVVLAKVVPVSLL